MSSHRSKRANTRGGIEIEDFDNVIGDKKSLNELGEMHENDRFLLQPGSRQSLGNADGILSKKGELSSNRAGRISEESEESGPQMTRHGRTKTTKGKKFNPNIGLGSSTHGRGMFNRGFNYKQTMTEDEKKNLVQQ